MVKKETWQNFGAAMKAGPGGGARARKSKVCTKGGYEAAASEDPGASSSGGEKLQFLTLPRLMSGNEIFLLARAAHVVGFWDVIRVSAEGRQVPRYTQWDTCSGINGSEPQQPCSLVTPPLS